MNASVGESPPWPWWETSRTPNSSSTETESSPCRETWSSGIWLRWDLTTTTTWVPSLLLSSPLMLPTLPGVPWPVECPLKSSLTWNKLESNWSTTRRSTKSLSTAKSSTRPWKHSKLVSPPRTLPTCSTCTVNPPQPKLLAFLAKLSNAWPPTTSSRMTAPRMTTGVARSKKNSVQPFPTSLCRSAKDSVMPSLRCPPSSFVST